eukprot:2431200-Alexandrium_andersonii.AAC.1
MLSGSGEVSAAIEKFKANPVNYQEDGHSTGQVPLHMKHDKPFELRCRGKVLGWLWKAVVAK